VTDPNGSEQVVYASENYGVRGIIDILDGPYPEAVPSINVQLPQNSINSIFTSAITSDSNAMQQSAHHSTQFYFNNFTGNITIQATLDPLPPNGNVNAANLSWANISTLQYTNQNTTDYYNFDGVFSAVRYHVIPVDGNISPSPVTKILYRA
jgi:hypothetical protein